MPHSTLKLSFLESGVQGVIAVPLPELAAAWKAVSPETPMESPAIAAYFQKHVRAEGLDGFSARWETQVTAVERQARQDGVVGAYEEVEVRFALVPDPAVSESARRALRLHYDAVLHQVVTHKALVFIERDWRTGILPDRTLQIGLVGTDIVSGKVLPIDIRLEHGSWWRGFASMILYGCEHILQGIDHILFLCMLMVVAPLAFARQSSGGPVRWSGSQGMHHAFRQFFKISAAFTLGHSLTLALSVYDLIQVPGPWIEFVVAFSVAVSAVHAGRPIYAGFEAHVAGIFGLAHGMAFASGLRTVLANDLDSRLLSLLGFNLGVELAQLAVMLFCLPLIRFSRHRGYVFLRVGLSILTLTAALHWMWLIASGSGFWKA